MKEIAAIVVGLICVFCMLSILKNEIRKPEKKEIKTLKRKKKAKRPAQYGPAYPPKSKENHDIIYFDGHRYRRD